jgi:hypothetical protein
MATSTTSGAVPESRRSFGQIVLSYIFWDYRRGSFHYDVMVTLILLFIFVTPHLWDFGARPTPMSVVTHPIQVTGYDTHGMLVTVEAADLNLPPGASDSQVKDALRKAIEPVTGDAVFVERWKTITDAQGNLEWQVWAHR